MTGSENSQPLGSTERGESDLNRSRNDSSRVSVTACQRCRSFKLKCSRERNGCGRCCRAKADCVYPSPPDRKRLRLERSSHPKRVRAQERSTRRILGHDGIQSSTDGQGGQPPTAVHATFSPTVASIDPSVNRLSSEEHSQNVDVTLESPVNLLSESYPMQLQNAQLSPLETHGQRNESSALPSRAVGLSLLEIYFTRAYNAALLFCKPLLFQDYLEGKIPDPLLKAIFAFAAVFLNPANETQKTESSELLELRSLNIFHSRSLTWAKEAMKEATMSAIEYPSLAIIQTLECVSLYWLTVGDFRAGDLCLALAYRSCSILGYNHKVMESLQNYDLSVEMELKRRCSWACWASMCIVAQPEAYIRSAWVEMAMVPLPATILNTKSGWEVVPGERMTADWCSTPVMPDKDPDTPPPIEAGLMKIVGVWAKVQLFVQDISSSSLGSRVETISALSHTAMSVLESTTPAPYRSYMKTITASNATQQFLTIDVLYHLSQLTLHSAVVPLFSGSSMDSTIDSTVVRTSAETVMHHANSLANLLAPYLNREADITHISPLVAYGAFATGAIFLTFERSVQERSAANQASRYSTTRKMLTVQAIVHLLDSLRVYWGVLQQPWEKLKAALEASLEPSHTQCSGARTSQPQDTSLIRSQRNPSIQYNIPHDASPSPAMPQVGQSSYPQTDINAIPTEGSFQTPADDVLLGPVDMNDDHWWNMSLAATSNDLFADLQLPGIFGQGWDGVQNP